MKDYVFKTQFNAIPDKGECNSGELVTEPGQSFTTREIYARFIQTGRVISSARAVQYDSEELGRSPDFEDYDDTQRPDFDITDAEKHQAYLTNQETQRKAIQSLSVKYASGQISYDEFCRLASEQNHEMAAPLIQRFGEALAKASAKVSPAEDKPAG